MKDLEKSRDLLRQQISATESQLEQLKLELARTEQQIAAEKEENDYIATNGATDKRNWPFAQDEYRRYGRQMIVDQIGLEGQIKLRDASVLIVGAGGLGCPSAMYLAGAGAGTIGIVDGDTVEQSNLHRQVLHRTRNVGKYKVDSAIEYLKELNPHPKYIPYRSHLTPQEAPDIFAQYDVILDCTDNPATRYLISDTAVLLQKVLVSASALRTDGQLMILNYPNRPPGDSSGGPCYRCVFPKPPPAASVVSCADGGILGPVVGLMGVMQALETIRVITNPVPLTGNSDSPGREKITPSLHLFSAYSSPPFRSIKLRSRRANCAACSPSATVTLYSLRSGSTDYVQFCGSKSPTSLLRADERISAAEYKRRFTQALLDPAALKDKDLSSRHILLDVRERIQYDICSLDRSINVPMSTILSSSASLQPATTPSEEANSANGTQALSLPWLPLDITPSSTTPATPIYVVCRLGNDSQVVVRKLKELGLDMGGKRYIGDIKGGLRAWRNEVDPELPDY